MKTKVCIHCHKRKRLAEYYAHPAMRDGHLGRCKECHKSEMRKNRISNPLVQERERQRAKQPHRKARAKILVARWRANNPERSRASGAINNAIRDGRLRKGSKCIDCGSRDHLFGIAADLSKPLKSIKWRCATCHHRGRFQAQASN